jgi:hypothetical protein
LAGRPIEIIQEWIGDWRGGLLLAEVVSMYMFSGMSGSKAVDVAIGCHSAVGEAPPGCRDTLRFLQHASVRGPRGRRPLSGYPRY